RRPPDELPEDADRVAAHELLVAVGPEVGAPGRRPAAVGAAQELALLAKPVPGGCAAGSPDPPRHDRAAARAGDPSGGRLGDRDDAPAAGQEAEEDLVEQLLVEAPARVALVEPPDRGARHSRRPAELGRAVGLGHPQPPRT